jgi:hypothetical protein
MASEQSPPPLPITKPRHGRVARQRVPATQNLSKRDEARPEANRISRAHYDRHSGISGWPVRAAARHGHDENGVGRGGHGHDEVGLDRVESCTRAHSLHLAQLGNSGIRTRSS